MMNMLSMAMRIFVLYTFIKWMFSGSTAPTQRAVTTTTADGRTVTTMQSSQVAPAWQSGQHFDIHVYVNNEAGWTADSLYGSVASSAELIPYLDTHLLWHEDDIAFEDEAWDSSAIRELNVTLVEPFLTHLLANQSLYAHIYISKHDTPHSPALTCKRAAELSGYVSPCSRDSGRLSSMHAVQRLNEYKPPPKIDTRKNLITGDRADKANPDKDNTSLTTTTAAGSLTAASDVPAPLWTNYWKPTLHIRLLHDFTVYPSTAVIPPEMKDNYRIDSATNSYLPVLYIDYFWLLSTHRMAINSTVSSLPLLLTYSPIGQFKYRGELSMEQSWRMQQQMGTHSEADTEMFKKIVLESNPYLLAVTMVVSCLHMLFDMLAFKNDISFWRNNKSTAGLSGRAVVMNTVMQAVIFLYLLDNETSWMILFSCGMGLLIECWKIPKLFRVQLNASFPFVHLTPVAIQTDADGVGVTEQDKMMQQTHKYDREAMVYLSYALYPLVGCYAVYSVFYQSHKSWYSFVLSTLVGSVYAFGFITMATTQPHTSSSAARSLWVNVSLQFLTSSFRSHSGSLPAFLCSALSVTVSAAVPELQAQVGGRHAVATDDVQGAEHSHRRPIRLRHHHAHATQAECVPR